MNGTSSWDWDLGNALSASELVIAIAGFSIAIVQLVRAARASRRAADASARAADASEATSAAIDELRRELAVNELLVSLPDLQRHEDAIDTAVRLNDRAGAEQALVQYTRSASDLVGLLRDVYGTDGALALARLLVTAANACKSAKASIAEDSETKLSGLTSNARSKVANANQRATTLRSSIQRKGDT